MVRTDKMKVVEYLCEENVLDRGSSLYKDLKKEKKREQRVCADQELKLIFIYGM